MGTVSAEQSLIECVEHEGFVIAYIIRRNGVPGETMFVTPDDFKQQLGFIVYPKGGEIARHTKASSAVVVTEAPIGRRYAGPLLRSLRAAGLRAHRIDVPSGDATKNLRQVARLYDAFLDRAIERGRRGHRCCSPPVRHPS